MRLRVRAACCVRRQRDELRNRLYARDDKKEVMQSAARVVKATANQFSALEALNKTDKDIAVAQAVEFAQYVVDHAKGRMVEAAERFLSLAHSQEIAARLKAS